MRSTFTKSRSARQRAASSLAGELLPFRHTRGVRCCLSPTACASCCLSPTPRTHLLPPTHLPLTRRSPASHLPVSHLAPLHLPPLTASHLPPLPASHLPVSHHRTSPPPPSTHLSTTASHLPDAALAQQHGDQAQVADRIHGTRAVRRGREPATSSHTVVRAALCRQQHLHPRALQDTAVRCRVSSSRLRRRPALASGSTTRPPLPRPWARALPLLLGSGPSPFEATRQPSEGRPLMLRVCAPTRLQVHCAARPAEVERAWQGPRRRGAVRGGALGERTRRGVDLLGRRGGARVRRRAREAERVRPSRRTQRGGAV